MPLKLASDLLPTASDVLPKSAKVIRLQRPTKARQAAVPTRITKATVGSSRASRGRKRHSIGTAKFQASGCGYIRRAAEHGSSSTAMQGDARRNPIGQASAIDPAAARKFAGDLLTRVAGGANPSVERRQARTAATVGDIFEAYLAHAEKGRRPPRSIRRVGTCGNIARGSTERPSQTSTARQFPSCTSSSGPKLGALRRTGCWPRCQQHGVGRSALDSLVVTIQLRMSPSLASSRASGFWRHTNCD